LKQTASLHERIGCTLADSNLAYVRSRFRLKGFQEASRFYPLADPQTNGGLLVAAPPDAATQLATNGFHDIGCITNSDLIEILDTEGSNSAPAPCDEEKHD
jgi:hypothetical protein